eukprot:301272-Rhodomonas_salina.4
MQDSKKQAADEEEDDDDEEEEEDDDDEKDYGKGSLVPCSHEAILKGHTKVKPPSLLRVKNAGTLR